MEIDALQSIPKKKYFESKQNVEQWTLAGIMIDIWVKENKNLNQYKKDWCLKNHKIKKKSTKNG